MDSRANPVMAVSPDGSKMVFVASDGNSGSQLWVRCAGLAIRPSDSGNRKWVIHFGLPMAASIAFSADGKLKKIALSGGAVETLAEVRTTSGTWSREGVVLFIAE